MQLKEWFFIGIANILPRFDLFNKIKTNFYRTAGMKIPEQAFILGPLTITPYNGVKNIHIGHHAFINTEVRFGCPKAKIEIGNNVAVGPRVSFETTGHGLQYIEGKGRGSIYKNIQIEDDVWIGAGVTILGGVTIGKGSVIAAGAVVIKDIPPYTVAGGVPAKLLKKIKPEA